MSGARTQPKSTFRRQAILIVLPVLVLAAVGLMSLRQDKILAEYDARERARVIANDLVPEIQALLVADRSDPLQCFFQVNDAGQLVSPRAYDPVPTPVPFDVNELDAHQARLWFKLQSADLGTADAGPLIQAARDLIGSNPPERFAAAARYDLGLLQIRQGEILEARETFGQLAEKYPEVRSESGIPFRAMAQFKACELSPDLTANVPGGLNQSLLVDAFCSNAVFRPTAMTADRLARIQERLVPPENRGATNSIARQPPSGTTANQRWVTPDAQAQIQKWNRIWENHEASRQLFSAARPYVTEGPLARSLVERTPIGPTGLDMFDIAPFRPKGPPQFFWVDLREPLTRRATASALPIGGDPWLVTRLRQNATSQMFRCVSEANVGTQVGALVSRTKLIPEDFGVSVELAGRKLAAPALDLEIWHYNQLPGSKGPAGMAKSDTGKVASTPLATAESEGGSARVKVAVYLTSPATFYRIQRIRAGWFGLVIAVSMVAALVGLVAAWRSFTRQQQLSEMKSNFVSSVSHELRAPIASVRLMAESLERGKIQEPQKQGEYFRFIVQECRRLSALIENVLDFSRIEQGRKQYEFEPTDLAAMTRETVRLLEPYATERQVQLKIELADDKEETSNIQHPTSNIQCPQGPSNGASRMFELSVDGRALQQALVNLIDNAVKHSPKGETVTIGLEVRGARCEVSGEGEDASRSLPDTSHLTPDTSSPDTLQLYVEDHGPGIPPDEHEKIFERFYRLGSELRRETQGVGIGLSIVKHIVDAHGGRVVVRSAVGEGSRFTIELPCKK